MRITFYRDQSFVRFHHAFVNSKDPDTHLITDIAVEVPLVDDMHEAAYSIDHQTKTMAIGHQRCAIFQENLGDYCRRR